MTHNATRGLTRARILFPAFTVSHISFHLRSPSHFPTMLYRHKNPFLSPLCLRYPSLFMAPSPTSKRTVKPSQKRRAGDANALEHASDARRRKRKAQEASERRAQQRARAAEVEQPDDTAKVRELQGASATDSPPRSQTNLIIARLEETIARLQASEQLNRQLSESTSSNAQPAVIEEPSRLSDVTVMDIRELLGLHEDEHKAQWNIIRVRVSSHPHVSLTNTNRPYRRKLFVRGWRTRTSNSTLHSAANTQKNSPSSTLRYVSLLLISCSSL